MGILDARGVVQNYAWQKRIQETGMKIHETLQSIEHLAAVCPDSRLPHTRIHPSKYHPISDTKIRSCQ